MYLVILLNCDVLLSRLQARCELGAACLLGLDALSESGCSLAGLVDSHLIVGVLVLSVGHDEHRGVVL